jgi:hypothetical protein
VNLYRRTQCSINLSLSPLAFQRSEWKLEHSFEPTAVIDLLRERFVRTYVETSQTRSITHILGIRDYHVHSRHASSIPVEVWFHPSQTGDAIYNVARARSSPTPHYMHVVPLSRPGEKGDLLTSDLTATHRLIAYAHSPPLLLVDLDDYEVNDFLRVSFISAILCTRALIVPHLE